MNFRIFALSLLFLANLARAECNDMQLWNPAMNMCDPLPMAGMPMRMAMLQLNAFATGDAEAGPRGWSAFAIPNMIMGDVGQSAGDHQYLNLEVMATAERWLYPSRGYPELLQIGENKADGAPFVDAQHPHSSPVMGLTLSDTIRFTESRKDYLKLSFAPRGESSDGPIAFMHRPTGQVNPDAPLGHHVGEDVGHVSSTVAAATLGWSKARFEVSAFHGAEPNPEAVDLPLGSVDSYAGRLGYAVSPQLYAMMSFAYVGHPEPNEPDISCERRYSISVYTQHGRVQTASILGIITGLDHAPQLTAITEEALLQYGPHQFWTRVEVLQRTPTQLLIANVGDVDRGQWLSVITLGHTHTLWKSDDFVLNVGASLSVDWLPQDFQAAYGSTTPVSGRIFVQSTGMKMWEL